MSLDTIVRKAVATANKLTSALQAPVIHHAWTGLDGYTKPTYTSKTRLCIVEWSSVIGRPNRIQMPTGEEITVRATLTFLVPIAANGADTRQEPIDPRDTFTLPDGSIVRVLTAGGVVDPSTTAPYALEVMVG